MPTIFSRIVNGEIPAYKVAESETCLAFLDINPLKEGHTLVIPKQETDYIFDLPDEAFTELHLFSKKVAVALERAVTCQRVGVAVLGLEVPHAHIHLVPIHHEGDLNFKNPRKEFTEASFKKLADSIQSEFRALD